MGHLCHPTGTRNHHTGIRATGRRCRLTWEALRAEHRDAGATKTTLRERGAATVIRTAQDRTRRDARRVEACLMVPRLTLTHILTLTTRLTTLGRCGGLDLPQLA